MSSKYDARTPAYKRKQTVRATPGGSSRAAIHMEYTPNKRTKQELAIKNLNDEDLADVLETPNRGGDATTTTTAAWKTIQLQKANKENIGTNSDDTRSNSSDNAPSARLKRSADRLPELSLLAHYDEIIRCYEEYFEDDISEEFLSFAEHQELCRLEWLKSVNECKRLQGELEKANHEIGDFSNKLKNARRLLDQEKKMRKRAEEERNSLEKQMILARDLLFSDKCGGRIPDDTKEKLAFLNNTSIRSCTSFDRNGLGTGQRLNTISEVNSHELNSTGSLLSDFSYSRSEDGLDLDVSAIIRPKREWKRCVPATEENQPAQRKRRSSSSHKIVEINPNDKIVATTTLSVSKDGPITATSIIEAVPQDEEEEIQTPSENDINDELKLRGPPVNDIVEKLWLESQSPQKIKSSSNIKRQHAFISKAVIRPDTCGSCNQRIRFGKIALKCKECRSICHMECKTDLPLPCVPIMNTPTQKGVIGIIADYAPTLPPMVPALIVHCINEIELRGLNEVGIYRVPGSEKDVKTLKEKFLRSKSAPHLNEIDIHVVCGVVKDFLRSLREPLVTNSLWKDFIQAVEAGDIMDIAPAIYQAISQLPQPNRDTLAYIMLHLNKVAESKDCKMPASNLAKVFGPTIVGYSSQDIEPHTLLTETRQQVAVMENLFKIPSDFWASYVNIDPEITTPRSKILLQTPSTESLSRAISGKFFTPTSAKSVQSMRKRRKFFPTPPSKK